MRYQFTRAVTIEHRKYDSGEVVGADDLPPGTLQSLLGVGWLVRVDPPKPEKATAKK